MFDLFADDPLANTCHENSTLEIFFDSCITKILFVKESMQ